MISVIFTYIYMKEKGEQLGKMRQAHWEKIRWANDEKPDKRQGE